MDTAVVANLVPDILSSDEKESIAMQGGYCLGFSGKVRVLDMRY